MNIRYDDIVHARDDVLEGSVNPNLPLCGDGTISAFALELTSDPVDCLWCVSILG